MALGYLEQQILKLICVLAVMLDERLKEMGIRKQKLFTYFPTISSFFTYKQIIYSCVIFLYFFYKA